MIRIFKFLIHELLKEREPLFPSRVGKRLRLGRPFKNQQSGAALLMAIFTITMLSIIANEISYESNVELIVATHSVNQVKAHYAAKAGVEISLLRIQIFRKAASALEGQDAIPKSMIDMIWNTPFVWPPPIPEDTSLVDKDQIQSAIKASNMESTYYATIEGESGKIDINDLASPSKVIAASVRAQLLQIFASRMENDEEFSERFRGFDFERLMNNITDWTDENTESLNGGDESSNYADIDAGDAKIPPNAPFKTIQELHMVSGMTDEIFEILAPRITVFGSKGINVNQADKDILMSLSPQITAERADKIIEARTDPDRGPFKDEEDFIGYLGTLGVTGNPFKEGDDVKIPLIFDPEMNFRIRSTGRSGKVEREITAIVYDFDRVKSRLKGFMAKPTPTPDPNASPTPTPSPTGNPQNSKTKKEKIPVPNERPNIVYWNET